MVLISSPITNWSVVVTTYTLAGPETGSSVISAQRDMTAIDAFDFAINAQGYFRIAIQEMMVSSLTIDVIEGTRGVTTIEITRD